MTDHNAAIQRAITEGVTIAIEATLAVASDDTATPADRLRASNMILNLAGLLGGDTKADSNTKLDDMATDDLRRLLQETKQGKG